jgi:hypothetical protein
MHASPIPTIIEILSARQAIRDSWSESRRADRKRMSFERQRQLLERLLDPFGSGRSEAHADPRPRRGGEHARAGSHLQ